jgi:hypothetical protein
VRPASPPTDRGFHEFDIPSMPRYSVYTECVFEWDPRKAEANAAKHGVSFDDAVTVFLDANALDGAELQHSTAERDFGGSVGRPTGACL